MIVYGTYANRTRIGPIGRISAMDLNEKAHLPGGGLIDTWTDDPTAIKLDDLEMAGVEVVDDDGETVFEGWIADTESEFVSLDVGATELTVVDLKDVLVGVDLRPEPATVTEASMFDTSAYYTLTGTVTEVIADLVDAHCGQAAPLERRRVTVDAPAPVGPTITIDTRFRKTLAEKVGSLAVEYGMVIDVYHDPATGLRFKVEEAPDRERIVVGPGIGNVTRYRYGWSRPQATHVIVGGQGELTSRAFATAELPNSRWTLRREAFIEHTEISTQADLEDAAAEYLQSVAGGYWFVVDVASVDGDRKRFGRDFGLGDTVTLQVGQTRTPLQVTAVKTVIDQDGTRRELTVGFPPADGEKLAISAARAADVRARSLGGQ